MSLTLDDARLRVAGGAAWLDLVAPGWPAKINLLILNQGCGVTCVIAQATDLGFWAGLRQLLLPQYPTTLDITIVDTTILTCGCYVEPEGWDYPTADYAMLTQAWRDLISARLLSTSDPSWPRENAYVSENSRRTGLWQERIGQDNLVDGAGPPPPSTDWEENAVLSR